MSLPPDPPDDLAEMADRFASRRTRASTWDDILSDEFRAHLRPGPDAASLFVIATAAGIFELSPVQRWRAAHAWVNMGWTTEAVLAAVTALSRPSQGRPRITNAPGLLRSWLDTGPQKARSRLEAHGLPSERGEALKRAREAEQEAADRWATLVARHRAVTKDLSHDERILAARALRRDLIHAIEQRGAPREPLEFLANHCRTLAEHLAFCEMHPELAPPRLNGDPDAR